MNKLLCKFRKSKACDVIFLLVIFIMQVIICSFFVNTHDDYVKVGLKTIGESWHSSIYFGNGRLLGNFLVGIFCNRYILNCLIKAVCMLLIIASLSYLCGKFSKKNLTVFFFLINGIPILFYREVFVWTHGFYNYTPPVALLLISLSVLKKIYLGGKINKPAAYTALIVCGVSAQLFSENSTVVNIVLAGILLLVFIIEKKKLAPVLINLFSSLAGAAVMIAVPRIYEVSDKLDFYRGFFSGGIKNIIVSAIINIGILIEYIGDMYTLWILLSVVILIALRKRKDRLSKASGLILTVFFSLSFLYFIPRILTAYGVINIENFISRYVNVAAMLIYFVFAFAAILKLFSKDELKTAFIFFPAALISAGELILIYPFSYRCLFITYILLSIPLVDLMNTVLKECKACRKPVFTALAVAGAVVFAVYTYQYSHISKINEARIAYAYEQIEEGKYEIELIEFPQEAWLYWGNKSYAYKYTFNHGDPEKMTFTFISYDEYLNQRSNQ